MMSRVIAGATSGLLMSTGLVAGSASTAGAYQPWGSTTAKNQVVKRSCHYYPYRYRIQAPTDEWSAEIFLVGPKGGGIASAALDAASDRARGKRFWRLCRASVISGRHTMRMKITWLRGYEKHEGWVKPSHFRLRRR